MYLEETLGLRARGIPATVVSCGCTTEMQLPELFNVAVSILTLLTVAYSAGKLSSKVDYIERVQIVMLNDKIDELKDEVRALNNSLHETREKIIPLVPTKDRGLNA